MYPNAGINAAAVAARHPVSCATTVPLPQVGSRQKVWRRAIPCEKSTDRLGQYLPPRKLEAHVIVTKHSFTHLYDDVFN